MPGLQVTDAMMAIHLATQSQLQDHGHGVMVLLDNSKAYDRVNHSWLWRVLERQGFGPTFQALVAFLYSSATSHFLVNGRLSNGIQIKRGVRQGDALSCFLYILAMAPLSYAWQHDPAVQGFTCLPDGQDVRIIQYADDTAILLHNADSLPALTRWLERVSQASNACINFDKSTIINMPDGQPIESIFTNLPPGETVRQLGFQMGITGIASTALSWTKKFVELNNKVDYFLRFPLQLQGRTLLFTSAILSKARFLAQIVPPEPVHLVKLESIARRLVWAGKKQGNTAYATLAAPKDAGGFGLPELSLWSKVALIRWVIRYIETPGALWQRILHHQLLLQASLRQRQASLFDPFAQKVDGVKPVLPLPWDKVHKAWHDLGGKIRNPVFFEDVLAQPVWGNSYYEWKKHPVAEWSDILRLKRCGKVHTFADLRDPAQGLWRPPACNCSDAGITSHFRATAVIVDKMGDWTDLPPAPADAAPVTTRALTVILPGCTLEDPHPLLSELTTKKIYNAHISASLPASLAASHAEIETLTNKPALYWNVVHSRWRDRRAAALHWLIIHNGLKIGKRLQFLPMNDGTMHLCKRCNTLETHQHLFFDCPASQNAWCAFGNLLALIWPQKFPSANTYTWPLIKHGFFPTKVGMLQGKAVLTALHGEMLRAIWLSRNDDVFNDTPKTSNIILSRFSYLAYTLVNSIATHYRLTKKGPQFLKIWGINNILASAQGQSTKVTTPAQLRAILS
jgi:hypothetical protein